MTDIISQIGKRNQNPTGTTELKSSEFQITGMANQQPCLVCTGRDPHQNQANLHQYINQHNQLINAYLLRTAQAQAADPSLVQILTQMQSCTQRPQCQPTSVNK